MITCTCGCEVEMREAQIGGGEFGNGGTAPMDCPVVVECEDCGRKWCDGDLVEEVLCTRCGDRWGRLELKVVSKPQDPPSCVSSFYRAEICPTCHSEDNLRDVDPRRRS